MATEEESAVNVSSCVGIVPSTDCVVCAQGVVNPENPAKECHPELALLAGSNVPGVLDGMGIRTRFYRPSGVTVEYRTRRAYVADSYNHRLRVIDLTDIPDIVEEDIEEWHELFLRALRQNLVFIIILTSSTIGLCCCTYIICRYCSLCPLYQRKLHQKRMKSMHIGQRV